MISGRSRAPARARERNNLVFSWKLSGLCRSSAPLLPTNFVDEPKYFVEFALRARTITTLGALATQFHEKCGLGDNV
jgi:hypothetical protein